MGLYIAYSTIPARSASRIAVSAVTHTAASFAESSIPVPTLRI
jgi:hypothetical protein